MKTRFLTVLMLLCLVCACAHAEPRAYTYGGSGDDALGEVAVSGDGRIVMAGYTNSSDGTLSSRTKTGRSGWALCIDAQGNVLWSFCTRLGDHDILRAPVWQADGSLTLMLDSEWVVKGDQELELIRLDARGEVVSRKTLLKVNVDREGYIGFERATDEGYVLRQTDSALDGQRYALYDWDGELLREMNAALEKPSPAPHYARGEHHLIRVAGNMRVLFAIDGRGDEIALAQEPMPVEGDLPTHFDALLSLEDGGAVGAGYVKNGQRWFDGNKGLLMRWDAQGNRVFEWWMEQESELFDILRTPGGFAALAYDAQEGMPHGHEWSLVFFDEQGVRVKSVPLGQATEAWDKAGRIAPLGDGGYVVVQVVGGGNDDACVVIVPKEDTP